MADDDVWLAPLAGGTARRLTADRVPVSATALSPDGSLVAFTSRRHGAAEAYVAGTEGGDVRRISWFGDGTTQVIGWQDDATVLAVAAAGQPFRSRTWAYALPVDGDGAPERLQYGPITRLGRSPGGAIVLGVNQSRARGASWKRYRGGTAAAMWIDRTGSGEFDRYMTELGGQLEDPHFTGERVVFLSDHEGVGNVYSALPDGSDLRRHSDHDRFYARAAAGDGERTVYQCAGGLWLVDDLAADSQPRQIEVELGSPRTGRAPRMLRAEDELGAAAPDETGRASAVEVRGSIYWLTHREGPARWLGGGDGVRGRMPCVVGRGDEQSVLFVTDAEGEDAIDVEPARGSLGAVGAGATGAGATGAGATGAGATGAGATGAGATGATGAGAPTPRRIGAGQIGRVLELAGAPDGRRAAVATHDGRVILVELASGELRTLDESPDGDASGLAFSPDSAWLAWSHAGNASWAPLRQIKLARVDSGEVSEVTTLRFHDHDPVFTLDGKYLAFLSERAFDPVHDEHAFDLTFLPATRPYLVTLQASTPSPFAAEPDGRPRASSATAGGPPAGAAGGAAAGGGGAGGDGAGGTTPPGVAASGGAASEVREGAPASASASAAGGGAAPATATGGGAAPATAMDGGAAQPPTVLVDLDGITERILPFPVAGGAYSQLRPAQNGVLFLANPVLGPLGEAREREGAEAARASLLRFDLTTARQTELVAELDGFEVSGDGRVVVVRDHTALRALPADRKVDPSAPADERSPDDLVEIDLSRIRIELDPPVEWRQMYDETARLMRDHFWVADMAGVDWDGVVARYRPLLEAVATRDDLSELIWEVQGELGSSHAYERPPELPAQAERRLGLLGADLVRDEDGTWRVATILPGETSVLAARSPLAAPGVAVRPGDAILAVDGRPVDPRLGPQPLLVGAAGKAVELTVAAGGGEVRRVVVEALGDERALRYQAWVAGRRAATHEATGGRVGYLHIPDMMAQGWAELHRDLRLEVARDALLVDVRDNGGGEVSELVLEKLSRHVTAWVISRHLEPITYPLDSPRGVRVLLTNEWAGSDGDIVTVGFRQRQLGPVIGMRTWGGVIGIDMRYRLVDGSSVTQPRYSFWFYDGFGWGVENHGVDPDIEVPFAPQDWASRRDPQLDRAVAVVLELLAEQPPARPPDAATRPSRAVPPLPPRP